MRENDWLFRTKQQMTKHTLFTYFLTGNNCQAVYLYINRIYNKILDFDWFCARLFVA